MRKCVALSTQQLNMSHRLYLYADTDMSQIWLVNLGELVS